MCFYLRGCNDNLCFFFKFGHYSVLLGSHVCHLSTRFLAHSMSFISFHGQRSCNVFTAFLWMLYSPFHRSDLLIFFFVIIMYFFFFSWTLLTYPLNFLDPSPLGISFLLHWCCRTQPSCSYFKKPWVVNHLPCAATVLLSHPDTPDSPVVLILFGTMETEV